mgnify:CR=1 FL=1
MEVKEMKELIAAVSSANVDEFEYNNEEFSIRICLLYTSDAADE